MTTSAIDTARHAITVLGALTDTQRSVMASAVDGILSPFSATTRTFDALVRHGLLDSRSAGTLSNLGHVLSAIACHGENEVLAEAGRQDAAAFIDEHCDNTVAISEGAAFAADDPDPAVVAFRAELLDDLHARAAAEDGRRRAIAFLAQCAWAAFDLGPIVDEDPDEIRDRIRYRAFRAVVLDHLHTMALETAADMPVDMATVAAAVEAEQLTSSPATGQARGDDR